MEAHLFQTRCKCIFGAHYGSKEVDGIQITSIAVMREGRERAVEARSGV